MHGRLCPSHLRSSFEIEHTEVVFFVRIVRDAKIVERRYSLYEALNGLWSERGNTRRHERLAAREKIGRASCRERV